MKTEQHAEYPAGNENTDAPKISGRRKLIRGGLLGAPIVMAVKSTTVWACHCKNPSGFSVSGNYSRTDSYLCADPARKPGSISSYEPLRQKKFLGSVTSGDAGLTLISGMASTYTLGQALSRADDAQIVAAAYINAAGTNNWGITKETVRKMWNDTANGASYSPIAGVNWKRADVVKYLKYVMAMPY